MVGAPEPTDAKKAELKGPVLFQEGKDRGPIVPQKGKMAKIGFSPGLWSMNPLESL